MALNIMMRWEGVTGLPPESCLDGRVHRPDACTYSRAVQQGTSLSITQTWRSGGVFDHYLRTVLKPAMVVVGAHEQPQVVAFEISDLFLPRSGAALPVQRTAPEPAREPASP